MNRSSRVTECKILDLHFQGYPCDEIAEMVGVAPITVSDAITLLPQSLKGLQELPVELKKQGLSVFEAKKARALPSSLRPLNR